MKLDYLHHINTYGENVVRLYDFNQLQATAFRQAIQDSIIDHRVALDLATLPFIEARNCTLTLRLAEEDLGMVTIDHEHFYCDMTSSAYVQLMKLLEPFCRKETKNHQWLYDIDNPTDFLFSPGGTW